MVFSLQEYHTLEQDPNLETKIASQKNQCNKENSLPQAKIFLGFVKHFTEFAKGIYETWDHNFFNLALTIVVVFSIVQFILFLFLFCSQ